MKKIATILIGLLLFGGSFAIAEQPAVAKGVKIVINGVTADFLRPTIISNGRTLLPFREVLNRLGVANDDKHILWNDADKSININADMDGNAVSIGMKIGQNAVKLSGKDDKVDVAPIIYENSTYIPVRFVAQALGKKVVWDDLTKTVFIRNAKGFDEVKDILTKSNAVGASLKRYKATADITLESKMANGTGDQKPITLYQKLALGYDFETKTNAMTYSVNMTGKTAGDETVYTFGDASYMQNKTTKAWTKVQSSKVMLNKVNQFSTQAKINVSEIMCAGLTVASDAPEGKIVLRGDVYAAQLVEPIVSSDLFSKSTSKVSNKKNYTELVIDKKTNLIEKEKIKEINSSITKSGEYLMTTDATIVLSDFDGDFKVELPADAANTTDVK